MQSSHMQSPHMQLYDQIAADVAVHGLALRGGFIPAQADAVPALAGGRPTATLLMIGNTGGAMWQAFEAAEVRGSHPLDQWVHAVIEPIAARHGATAVYPYDAPPLPFQRWAARAWPLFPSPLGLLIDAEFGLWHALRAALLFSVRLPLPVPPPQTSPCDRCSAKPCLSACPINAFTPAGFDYQACRAYLATLPGDPCLEHGCQSRRACPVGVEHTYAQAQLQFHQRTYSGVVRRR